MVENITTVNSQQQYYYFKWEELRKAYQMFMVDTSQSILHILAAGHHSRWQAWVMARLLRQAHQIVNKEVTVDLATLHQLPPDRWSLCTSHDQAWLYGRFVCRSRTWYQI
jgi:hypothetical protein